MLAALRGTVNRADEMTKAAEINPRERGERARPLRRVISIVRSSSSSLHRLSYSKYLVLTIYLHKYLIHFPGNRKDTVNVSLGFSDILSLVAVYRVNFLMQLVIFSFIDR
jgi:hypothetical protein